MIRIVTDSSANISQQEAAALGIEVIPLTVIFGTEAYLEGPEITADAFYERLTGGEFPHTSQPSSAQLSEAFARCGGEETIAIFISSKLSGTVEVRGAWCGRRGSPTYTWSIRWPLRSCCA